MNSNIVKVVAVCSVILLAGCQATLQQTSQSPTGELKPSDQQEHATASKPSSSQAKSLTPAKPIATETLYSLLVAEISASRKNYDTTLEHYVTQARTTRDTGVVARAARIAQFLKAQQEALEMGKLWLSHDPDNTEAIALVANAYLELDQPLVALDYTEQLLDIYQQPSTSAGHTDSGAFAETIANFSKDADVQTIKTLIQRFESLAEQYSDLSGIKVALSVLHQQTGSVDQSLDWINRALEQQPERTTAIVQQVILLQENQQSEVAITKLKELLDKNPANSRLRLVYARLLSQTDVSKAYEQFSQLSIASPQQLDLKLSRALLAIELGNLDEAKPLLLELLASDYRLDDVNYYMGYIEESLARKQTALQHYLSVTEGKNFLSAQHRAARIMVLNGDIADVQELYRKLHERFPEKKEELYTRESDLLVRGRADDEALKVLDQAIEEFPDNIDLRHNRSTVYERRDQLALMESDLRHVLALDPNNAYALNSLGYYLSIRTERYQEAYELIKRALALKPKDAAIIDSMGWILFKLGNLVEAQSYLQQAFELYPDPEVAAHLGEVLWVQGKKDEAIDVLENNLADNPNAPEILEIIKRLGIPL